MYTEKYLNYYFRSQEGTLHAFSNNSIKRTN